MKNEHKEILSFIGGFLDMQPELRFVQALTHFEVLEFADKSKPLKQYVTGYLSG